MGRRIVVVRHGERVDGTFTEDWIKNCIDEHGNYKKNDLNMPGSIVKRVGSPNTFIRDCPLTQIGFTQGKLVGEGLRDEKVLKDGFEVYVSPALRSIETATAIRKKMNANFKMKIDYCFFEWTTLHPEYPQTPAFLTTSELIENGFSIDESYSSSMTPEPNELLNTYYQRTHKLILQLLSQSDNDILIVAHGGTLDAVTRPLTGRGTRDHDEFMGVLRSTPYCAVAVAEEEPVTKKWTLPQVPRLNFSHNRRFDFYAWHTLQ